MADEDEWVEEETLVVAELSGLIDTETMQKGNMKCHVLGIDTDKPLLQLDNYLFSGHYEDTLGTDLIFKTKVADSSKGEMDPKNLEFHCTSTKKLVMQRTFLQNKNISEGTVWDINEEEETVEEEAVPVQAEEEDEMAVKNEAVASTSGAVIFHTHTSRGTSQTGKSGPANQTSESSQSTSTSTSMEDPSGATPSGLPLGESSSSDSASKCPVSGSKATDSASTSTDTSTTKETSTTTDSTEVQT